MKEILTLKQELLEGNFSEALRLTTELEIMSRQDKINALENFLALMVSRLIVIQIATDYLFQSHINDIRNSLIEIQQRNRLGADFFIQENDWSTLYENVVDYAILIAAETTELWDDEISPEQLQNLLNFEQLRIETLKLIRLIYSLNVLDIDRYLRQNWPQRQIYLH
ncbi:MAG: hypothetical protein ACRC80_25840 [Waterburya sp.]